MAAKTWHLVLATRGSVASHVAFLDPGVIMLPWLTSCEDQRTSPMGHSSSISYYRNIWEEESGFG